jgi:hypothetical protein
MIEDLLGGFKFPAAKDGVDPVFRPVAQPVLRQPSKEVVRVLSRTDRVAALAVCKSLIAGKAPPPLAAQIMQRRRGAEDDGALSVYDAVDQLDDGNGNGGGFDLTQAIHDAAVALGAQCAPLQQAKSKNALRRTETRAAAVRPAKPGLKFPPPLFPGARGRTSKPRAAVMARARARKFQAVQNIGLTVAEAESAPKPVGVSRVTAPESGAAGGVRRY